MPIAANANRVVYFPACPTRMFGANPTKYDLLPAPAAMLTLLRRAGFDVIECGSVDEALEIAGRHPVARFGAVEIRPFVE